MSDRQLNSFSYSHLRVDRNRLLSQGYIWEYQIEPFLLTTGNGRAISFTTGPHEVLVTSLSMYIPGDQAILESLLSYNPIGVGEGTPVAGVPRRHFDYRPDPMVEVTDGVIFFTSGSQIARDVIVGGGDFFQSNPIILASDTQYLFTIEAFKQPGPAFTAPYVYTTGNAAPAPGEAIYRAAQNTLRVHHTDDDGGNQQANLEGVEDGWYITNTAGGSYTVLSVSPGASDVSYNVTGSGGTAGRSDWTFSGPSGPDVDTLLSIDISFAALPPELV